MVGNPITLKVLPRDDLLPCQVHQRKWRRKESILGFVQDCMKLILPFGLTLGIALEEGSHPGFSQWFCDCYGVDVMACLKEGAYRCGYDVHIVCPHGMEAFGKEGERHFAAGAPFAVHKDKYAAVLTDYIPVAPPMPLEVYAADGTGLRFG